MSSKRSKRQKVVDGDEEHKESIYKLPPLAAPPQPILDANQLHPQPVIDADQPHISAPTSKALASCETEEERKLSEVKQSQTPFDFPEHSVHHEMKDTSHPASKCRFLRFVFRSVSAFSLYIQRYTTISLSLSFTRMHTQIHTHMHTCTYAHTPHTHNTYAHTNITLTHHTHITHTHIQTSHSHTTHT